MDDINDDLLTDLIEGEGLKHFPYTDTSGHISIGIGRNLTDVGLSLDEIYYLARNDVNRCYDDLRSYQWFTHQPECVQHALVRMCFNLGIYGLLSFKKMIAALEKKDYEKAAREALDSKWHAQVGNRAERIAEQIRKGRETPIYGHCS